MSSICIKKSTTNGAPPSLKFGELAINSSGTLFVGNSLNIPRILCVKKVLNLDTPTALDFNSKYIIGNTTASGFIITLPDITSFNNIYDGFEIKFKNNGTITNHHLTINTFNNAQFIESVGQTTVLLDKGEFASYVCSIATMCWERIG